MHPEITPACMYTKLCIDSNNVREPDCHHGEMNSGHPHPRHSGSWPLESDTSMYTASVV